MKTTKKGSHENGLLTKPLRYHLRFQIVPDKNIGKNSKSLANFCKKHGIEEVVIIFAAEEWNNGLLSKKEEDRWFNAVKKVKLILDKNNIATSLNPWMTVLHCDRGRSFPKGRKFKPMVSPKGETSKACASFADKNWIDYIGNIYGRFAKLGFRIVWIEDDFRYHNHAPLTWGGGFEQGVVKRFSKKIGHKTSREQVVKNILKPGVPHPWRTKWMETWREIQLEAAKSITEAVKKNSASKSIIGLMSSVPGVHSIEGRDWQKLFNTLSINGKVAHRPHFAGYSEVPGRNKDYSIMMLDVQKDFRPYSCEVAPEIENFPFSDWNKSDSLTWAEMAFSMFYGSDALLLNLFPISGNSVDNEKTYIGNLLDKSRPALEWISKRFLKNMKTLGVGIPWKQDASMYVRTCKGQDIKELETTSFEPGHFLLSYGIPVSSGIQKVNSIFGNVCWAYSNEEVLRMLAGGLLLDGTSVKILNERGFGEYVGVNCKGIVNREEDKYALEVVNSKETCIHKGFYFNVNVHPYMAKLEPRRGAQEWTTITTSDRKRFGAGMIVYKNRLGGIVASYAAVNPAKLPRSYQRQIIAQKVIDLISSGRFHSIMVKGSVHLLPIHFEEGGKNFIVVFNGSAGLAKPVIQINLPKVVISQATLLAPLEKPVEIENKISCYNNSTAIIFTTEIPYLGFLVVELQK